jgi:hypothetical protein
MLTELLEKNYYMQTGEVPYFCSEMIEVGLAQCFVKECNIESIKLISFLFQIQYELHTYFEQGVKELSELSISLLGPNWYDKS